jgi:hypothetical protein
MKRATSVRTGLRGAAAVLAAALALAACGRYGPPRRASELAGPERTAPEPAPAPSEADPLEPDQEP